MMRYHGMYAPTQVTTNESSLTHYIDRLNAALESNNLT